MAVATIFVVLLESEEQQSVPFELNVISADMVDQIIGSHAVKHVLSLLLSLGHLLFKEPVNQILRNEAVLVRLKKILAVAN